MGRETALKQFLAGDPRKFCPWSCPFDLLVQGVSGGALGKLT